MGSKITALMTSHNMFGIQWRSEKWTCPCLVLVHVHYSSERNVSDCPFFEWQFKILAYFIQLQMPDVRTAYYLGTNGGGSKNHSQIWRS